MTHTCYPARRTTSLLFLFGLSFLSLNASAQITPEMSAALGASANTSANPTINVGANNGFPVVPRAPGMPMTPDLGAADAQRGMVVPLQVPKPQSPSQFQRFVQTSTGKMLPHFGSTLFDNPQAYAVDAAAPAPGEYVLGPGDEVRIQIWGSVDFAGSQTLDRNGQITLPKIGTLQLNGVQVKDLEATLRQRVATVYRNVTLSASLGKLRGITVYVVGQARQPGTYNLNSLSTLVNAVFASGGPGVNGSMRTIQLKRNGQTVTTLDLYDFIAKGDKSQDAALQPGDVIMIPPAGPRMALTGATDHGAIYELKHGSTVQDVLALGGGLPSLASTQRALLERIQASPGNAQRQVLNLELSPQGLAQSLQDGDVLTLLKISPAFANAVTLQGTVAQALRHSWAPGMRVQDLIPDREALITPDYYERKNKLVQILDAQNDVQDSQFSSANTNARVRSMVDQINWDYAVIERLNRTELRTELIPFNLGKAVVQQDPAHNLELLSGDVVTIMSSADLQLPAARRTRLVRIEGEVNAPGLYQAMAGETLPQLLQRVGGLTPHAYVYGAEFTRESVRRQQQNNLDQLVRRLESQLQSATATLVANLSGERAAQAEALQRQQQEQMKSQIERLKLMRSQGRVTLGLPTTLPQTCASDSVDAQCLQNLLASIPGLPLEDGDVFSVPGLPSFVTASGSVINENVFIHKSGKTVGDVVASAGLNEDADIRQSFLLRADGSILARRGAGLFSNFDNTPVMPGDTLVVPPKVDRENSYNFVVRALKDWTQILSSLGIGAAAIRSLEN
jgi:protein involved in polysaccharide export with SLBB domain